MELPVLLQLRELGAALATGLALGLAYDCLRPLGRGRLLTACADFLYALLSLAALLTFALWDRGRDERVVLGLERAVPAGPGRGPARPRAAVFADPARLPSNRENYFLYLYNMC